MELFSTYSDVDWYRYSSDSGTIGFSDPTHDPHEFISIDWDNEKIFPKITHCKHTVGRMVKDGDIKHIPCKLWSCPHCSKVKKQRMIKRFEHYCKPDTTYVMLTLTEWKHPSNHKNAQMLTKHWNNLRASMRKHGVKITDYFWVKEYKPLHEENPKYKTLSEEEKLYLYPHMHILIPSILDRDLIKRLWKLATGGTADNIHMPEAVDPYLKNPAAYLTKYVTKADMQDGFHRRERRFGFSRNYKPQEIPYKYLKHGRVETYVPFVSDKSSLFFLNSNKAPDSDLLKFEMIFKKYRQEWHDTHLQEHQEYCSKQDAYEASRDALQDELLFIDSYILDLGINADYKIPSLPEFVDPSIEYAKEKLKFTAVKFADQRMRMEYSFL